MNSQARGFTLIELMIVVAVAAILAAVAVPSYRQYVMRANRADATAALLRLASAQERFYLQNNRYADADEMDDAPPAGLGIAGTERGYYTLAIDSDDLALGYVVTATVVDGGPQDEDTQCAGFSVDQQGLRRAEDSGGDANTDTCWR